MRDRRYRQLIDRFQHRLFVRVIAYGLIYQATLWNFLFCWRLVSEGGGDFFAQYWAFFLDSYPMLFCTLVLVPVFACDAVKFSHRVAGPIYRFRVTMLDVAAGRPVRRVTLRRNDELGEMQDDFNTMLDALARRGAVTLAEAGPLPRQGGWPKLELNEQPFENPNPQESRAANASDL